MASAPEVYRASWFHFDNATGAEGLTDLPLTERGQEMARHGLFSRSGVFVSEPVLSAASHAVEPRRHVVDQHTR